jgi:hypothetical protein
MRMPNAYGGKAESCRIIGLIDVEESNRHFEPPFSCRDWDYSLAAKNSRSVSRS